MRARAAGDARLQAHALIALTTARLLTDPEGKADELHRVSQQSIPLFTELGDHRGLARSWLGIAAAYLSWVRFDAQRDALEHALVHAREAREPSLERLAVGELGYALVWGRTTVEEGVRRCAEVREEMRASPVTQCGYAGVQAVLEAMAGRFDAARRCIARNKELVTEFGIVDHVPGEFFWHGRDAGRRSCRRRTGDPSRIRRSARDRQPRPGLDARRAARRGAVRAASRRGGGADHRDARVNSPRATTSLPQAYWRKTRAKILARRGRHHEAERLAREAVEILAAHRLRDGPGRRADEPGGRIADRGSRRSRATRRRGCARPLRTEGQHRLRAEGARAARRPGASGGHAVAAASSRGRRRETICDTPSEAIVTP